jgi:hypothetical protein
MTGTHIFHYPHLLKQADSTARPYETHLLVL